MPKIVRHDHSVNTKIEAVPEVIIRLQSELHLAKYKTDLARAVSQLETDALAANLNHWLTYDAPNTTELFSELPRLLPSPATYEEAVRMLLGIAFSRRVDFENTMSVCAERWSSLDDTEDTDECEDDDQAPLSTQEWVRELSISAVRGSLRPYSLDELLELVAAHFPVFDLELWQGSHTRKAERKPVKLPRSKTKTYREVILSTAEGSKVTIKELIAAAYLSRRTCSDLPFEQVSERTSKLLKSVASNVRREVRLLLEEGVLEHEGDCFTLVE